MGKGNELGFVKFSSSSSEHELECGASLGVQYPICENGTSACFLLVKHEEFTNEIKKGIF